MPPRINEELRKLLCDVRARRNFKEREWIDGKCAMLNDYMKKSGLTACVINMSGGVDSSCVAALCMEASKKPGSPIEKVLGIAQPIKSTASIQNRAYECANAIGLEIVTIDQSAVFDSLTPIVGITGNQFATGQLKCYMRTPVVFYVAQLLACSGKPAIVMGTGNKDEDGYLFYFCKAGDGVSDVQLIADLHKSEVFRVARALGVPQSILEAPPSADLWDGQTDEDELGVSYDFVEVCASASGNGDSVPFSPQLYTEWLLLPKPEQDVMLASLSIQAREEFDKSRVAVDTIHRRNKHKEKYPLNLNIL